MIISVSKNGTLSLNRGAFIILNHRVTGIHTIKIRNRISLSRIQIVKTVAIKHNRKTAEFMIRR